MHTESAVFHAKFNPLIKPFLVVQIGFVMCCTVIGIPLAILWFLGVGRWWAQHYYDKLECHLSDRTLRYRKGILVTVEKTIPLENIQDVTFVEGPILRRFQLSTLKFETAGHSVGQAGDMRLTGIIDAQEFKQQDHGRARGDEAGPALRRRRAGRRPAGHGAAGGAARDRGQAGRNRRPVAGAPLVSDCPLRPAARCAGTRTAPGYRCRSSA